MCIERAFMHLPNVQECTYSATMIKYTPFSEIISQIETGLGESGIPVAELCRRAGIAQTTWGRWKSGKFLPRDETRETIIGAYNELIKPQSVEAA